MGRALTPGCVFMSPDQTVAVFVRREMVPLSMLVAKREVPPFVMFTAQGYLGGGSEMEVLPNGLGLLSDPDHGGVVVVAPRVVEAGDTVDASEFLWDTWRRRWVEAWEVGDYDERLEMVRIRGQSLPAEPCNDKDGAA